MSPKMFYFSILVVFSQVLLVTLLSRLQALHPSVKWVKRRSGSLNWDKALGYVTRLGRMSSSGDSHVLHQGSYGPWKSWKTLENF